MNRRRLLIRSFSVAALFSACAAHQGSKPRPPATSSAASAQPTASPSPSPAAPARATGTARGPSLGDGIHWFRTAAEYRAIAISTYRAASDAVTLAARNKARDGWAVVLDADETVLDNSVFQRDLAAGNAPFTEEMWAAFVRKRVSVPVPGAKAFLEKVRELGGRIVIVTNRWNTLCDDTRENFKAQSLPFDAILCRESASDKNSRFESARTGAAFGDSKAREILAFVGDNIQDFPSLKQALRDEPDAAFAEFGRRYFVLPNPMYGSWQQVPPR